MSTNTVIDQITEALSPILSENEELREGIAEVRAMLAYEDRNWQLLTGANGDQVEGLELDQVKQLSEKARTRVAASSLDKRAADLHAGYVFGAPVEIDGTERDTSKSGPPLATVRFFENPINQESIFSGAAKRELQHARFTDGNVIVFCDTAKKTVRRIPIYEIEDVLVNPEYPDEVWAWMRQWNQRDQDGKSTTKRVWAYTNRFTGTRQTTIQWSGKPVPVLQNTTAVDLRANRQVGWVFGIGDALAGMHWAEAYGKVMTYGQTVAEGLAKIIYKVTNTKSKQGAQNIGVKMGSGGVGQGVALGEGQDIQLVNATQRSFDFTAARPLAAMAAAAWNVSNIDLLSDSSAAGSSYGAAQSLSEGVRNAMKAMRSEWTQFYQDIFQACGMGRPGIHWAPMEQPDAYRMAQELTLYSVALTDEEYRSIALDRLDIPGDASIIPPSLAMRNEPARQAASPDQGRSNATGGQDSGSLNDQRSDNISEVMKQMNNENFLSELASLVERLEAATN